MPNFNCSPYKSPLHRNTNSPPTNCRKKDVFDLDKQRVYRVEINSNSLYFFKIYLNSLTAFSSRKGPSFSLFLFSGTLFYDMDPNKSPCFLLVSGFIKNLPEASGILAKPT